MINKKYILTKNSAKLSLAFMCALHLLTSAAICGHFELEDFDLKQHQAQYNSLSSVEESDANLKQANQFQSFLAEAKEIVTRYELEQDVGLRLVHRHFLLGNNQIMAEKYELIKEVPSLVTTALSLETAKQIEELPSSWIFTKQPENPVSLFESSSDPAVKNAHVALKKSPEFFEELGKSITAYNLNDLISLAVLRRQTLVPQDDQIYMEINSEGPNQSVVQLWDANKNQQAIQTSWSFKGREHHWCWAHTYCLRRDEAHGGHLVVHDHTWMND